MARVRLDRYEAEEGDLPPVCICCGARARDYVRRKFVYYPVLLTTAVLIRMMVTRRMTTLLPCCPAHAGGWLWAKGPGGWWGLRPVQITADSITLTGVAEEFVAALEKYRDRREEIAGHFRPRRRAVAERERPRRRRTSEIAEVEPVEDAGSGSSSAGLWVLLSFLIAIPLLLGLAVVGLLWSLPRSAPLPPAFAPPAWNPPPPGGNVAAQPAHPEQVVALLAGPPANGPADLPWAALLLNGRPDLPRPLPDDELKKILADLRPDNFFGAREGADRLAKALPTAERRAEVAQALEGLLKSNHPPIREAGARALAVWGGPENVPALLQALAAEHFPHLRGAILDALAALKDARAADPVAKLLTDFPSRDKARQTLQALGPAAEQAVLPYVAHANRQTRIEACEVLEVTGTKASVPALQAAAQAADPGVAQAAQKALAAIAAR
jgi:hypothetical protein